MSTELKLRIANTFYLRMLGLHADAPLAEHEALLLTPCRSVHTFFLHYSIDIVFLDARAVELRCIHALAPGRVAWERKAEVVVELPAGYCQRHPGYLQLIHAALRLRVSPRLP